MRWRAGQPERSRPEYQLKIFRPRCVGTEFAGDPLEALAIGFIEARDLGRIQIEHSKQALAVKERHHDFRAAARIAGDVTRKGLYVRHQLALALSGRGSANSLAQRNIQTGR